MNKPTLAGLRNLLEAEDLPTADLYDLNLDDCFCIGEPENPQAVIGVQRFGELGLLRSLAVRASTKGQGVGKQMVAHLEQYCAEQKVTDIYLLTTTAERFFLTLGYLTIPRNQAPDAIKATAEFSSICPGDAAVMHKALC